MNQGKRKQTTGLRDHRKNSLLMRTLVMKTNFYFYAILVETMEYLNVNIFRSMFIMPSHVLSHLNKPELHLKIGDFYLPFRSQKY